MNDVHSTSGDLQPLNAVRTGDEVAVPAAVPAYQPLTDEEALRCNYPMHGPEHPDDCIIAAPDAELIAFARAIESAVLARVAQLGGVSVPSETAAGAQKQDHSEIAELEQEASLMRARNERLQQERDALLEACRELMQYAEIIEERCDSVATDKARAAIAKAEGRA